MDMELGTVRSKDSSKTIFRKLIWRNGRKKKKTQSMEMWVNTVSADHDVLMCPLPTSFL